MNIWIAISIIRLKKETFIFLVEQLSLSKSTDEKE